MRLFFLLALLAASAAASGQTDSAKTAGTTAGEDSRKALIKSALGRERGAITSMEPSTRDEGGVILGYSSGAVVYCHGEYRCRPFEQTPDAAVSTPVTAISVSGRGSAEVVWVAYPNAVLYQCSNFVCRQFDVPDATTR